MKEQGKSYKEQTRVEQAVSSTYKMIKFDIQRKTYKNFVILDTENHSEFCHHALKQLPSAVSTLTSGQPWLLYWLLHSLDLMGEEVSPDTAELVIQYLNHCKCRRTGVFCGGPYQLPHLAPIYSSVTTLLTLGTQSAFEAIDCQAIRRFVLSMKRPDIPGAFRMHEFGESDMRSLYCAISVSYVLNILDDEIADSVAEYIGKAQSYEGGLGGEPGGEAHGGYTYCGLASLVMLKRTDALDLHRLLEWCAARQMPLEGGFNGRTNKLVDSCYSFWVGACFNLLKEVMRVPRECSLYDNLALQAYVLVCCQAAYGLFDKPGSMPDYYHTAYSLSGLSHAQLVTGQYSHVFQSAVELRENDALFNVEKEKVKRAYDYFRGHN